MHNGYMRNSCCIPQLFFCIFIKKCVCVNKYVYLVLYIYTYCHASVSDHGGFISV